MRDLLSGFRYELALERLDGFLASHAVANAKSHGGANEVSNQIESEGCFHLCNLHTYYGMFEGGNSRRSCKILKLRAILMVFEVA
jgi:hypothetical protein